MMGFPGGSDGKESTCNSGDLGSIAGSGRSPGEGNGNLLQYSCQGNPMHRGAWRDRLHSAANTTEETEQARICIIRRVNNVVMKRAVEREELNTGDLAQVFSFCPWSPVCQQGSL